jgi:hypothetical protein
MDRLSLKLPMLPYFFLSAPQGSMKLAGRQRADVAGALSEFWLRPFPFSRGLHAGILLLACLNNRLSNSWVALFK